MQRTEERPHIKLSGHGAFQSQTRFIPDEYRNILIHNNIQEQPKARPTTPHPTRTTPPLDRDSCVSVTVPVRRGLVVRRIGFDARSRRATRSLVKLRSTSLCSSTSLRRRTDQPGPSSVNGATIRNSLTASAFQRYRTNRVLLHGKTNHCASHLSKDPTKDPMLRSIRPTSIQRSQNSSHAKMKAMSTRDDQVEPTGYGEGSNRSRHRYAKPADEVFPQPPATATSK